MAIAGVVGHGVGIVDGEPGVKVFLATPGVAGVPSRLDDVPVAVEVTGMFVAGGTTDKTSPAPNGYSIGHPNITAGTLGAVVRDASNQCYILSNNHVLADVNNAAIGDNTLQPGPFDGGQNPQDAIATLADFEPIDLSGSDNVMDAAISAIFSAADVTGSAPGSSDSPPAYGTPSESATEASVGTDVQKFGRTTLWTHGEIDTENVTASICYECAGPFCLRCKAAATFVNLLSIPDATATDASGNPANFSDGGDSGSLIVTETGSNPTALLFAGSSTRTLAHPIQPVLTRFGVEIETDLNQCTGGGTPSNLPPTADFSFTTDGLTADFTDGSFDNDGSVVGWSWDFGDGNGSSAQNPSHTYSSGGTRTVSLTVTDNDGDTDTASQSVTVTDGGTGGISLSASGYKVRGLKKADLTWSGANFTNVDVYRDGEHLTTTANNGAYTDNIDQRGGGSYFYQVCEAGTSTCSNEAAVSF
jgi:PKD repeat protein